MCRTGRKQLMVPSLPDVAFLPKAFGAHRNRGFTHKGAGHQRSVKGGETGQPLQPLHFQAVIVGNHLQFPLRILSLESDSSWPQQGRDRTEEVLLDQSQKIAIKAFASEVGLRNKCQHDVLPRPVHRLLA